MSNVKKSVKAADVESKSVLGTFTGKCCDSNVFNNNDMHLSRELFEKLMESEEYKRAMENHHYIGYLGHPSDSDCQDYEHACIVMKDMRIADNGEIEGDFDLIDTPVGRTVKAFIDAGVNFGISIRGLGEVDGNGEVDPDEFIFRGFDLVTFPAYDDCIPEFKQIAASTDAKKQAKYKKICAAIDTNLPDIDSCEALVVLQEQLPDGCDEFNKIQDRINELNCGVADDIDTLAVTEEKLEAMTELYLDAAETVRNLELELADCELANKDLAVECKTLKQKWNHLNRITANQIADANQIAGKLENERNASRRQTRKIKASVAALEQELSATKGELSVTKRELSSAKQAYDKQVTANTNLRNRLDSIIKQRRDDREAIKASDNVNLKYQQKIEANKNIISEKDSIIDDLNKKLNETVVASKKVELKASNLDEKNKELLSRIEAAEEMISSYQQAYANIYANALGVYLTGLPITANTSVEELTDMIKAGTSTANIPAAPAYYSEDVEDDTYIEGQDDTFDGNYSAGMVTL